MVINKINPISFEKFTDSLKVENKELVDYQSFFSKTISDIKRFAVGPFFWVISNHSDMKVIAMSDNISQLTSFPKEKHIDFDFWLSLIHPDDRLYLMGAMEAASNIYYGMDEINREYITLNLYARMINQHNQYRWILIQSPLQYLNQNGKMESCLIVIYDLSHFEIKNMPIISIIDSRDQEKCYEQHINMLETKLPLTITKRELEILTLVSQGYNSPEIAEKLFIAYSTVEKHKSNLRTKTNTRTSAELIAYCIRYNII